MLRHYDSKRLSLLKETKRTLLPIKLQTAMTILYFIVVGGT